MTESVAPTTRLHGQSDGFRLPGLTISAIGGREIGAADFATTPVAGSPAQTDLRKMRYANQIGYQ